MKIACFSIAASINSEVCAAQSTIDTGEIQDKLDRIPIYFRVAG